MEVEGTSSLLRRWESHCVTTWWDAWCSASLSYLSQSASSPPPDVSILSPLSWCARELSELHSQHHRNMYKSDCGHHKSFVKGIWCCPHKSWGIYSLWNTQTQLEEYDTEIAQWVCNSGRTFKSGKSNMWFVLWHGITVTCLEAPRNSKSETLNAIEM